MNTKAVMALEHQLRSQRLAWLAGAGTHAAHAAHAAHACTGTAQLHSGWVGLARDSLLAARAPAQICAEQYQLPCSSSSSMQAARTSHAAHHASQGAHIHACIAWEAPRNVAGQAR